MRVSHFPNTGTGSITAAVWSGILKYKIENDNFADCFRIMRSKVNVSL